jgi:hypothetical protein
MKHLWKISPGLTVIATLIDAAPPGLASGVDRLPVTAAIHHLLGEVPFPCQIEK